MFERGTQFKRWWNREDVVLLVLLGALFLLPGLGQIPLFERDEPRFASAARGMLETGDYIVPRFNGALRPDKPPLVYWLMDLGYVATGGVGELGARLPSAVCGTLTLIVVYFMVGSRFGRLTGFVAAMMLGSCALFVVEGRMATADGTMLLFIVICMACAWRAWDAAPAAGGAGPMRFPRADYLLDRNGEYGPLALDQMPVRVPRQMPFAMAMVFWVALAAGALTKGVPLAFVLVPMAALSIATGALPEQLRKWRSHFHFTRGRVAAGIVIAGATVALVIGSMTTGALRDFRLLAALVGVLVMAMIVTPGLPLVVGRCLFRGNWGWWRQLRPAVGFPLLAVLVGWWVVWAGVATHWKLIEDMVGTHFLNRIGLPTPDATPAGGGGSFDPMRAYSKPPGTYLAAVWVTFWPWCILLVPAGFHMVRRLLGKTAFAIDSRPYQFLAAWIVPMWVLLELARGKLLHYPLPIYVPLAIVCADTLVQSWNRLTEVLESRWVEGLRWWVLGIWLVLGIGLLAGARMTGDGDLFWKCVPFGLTLVATGFASAWTWGKPSWPYVVVLCWGGALLMADTILLPGIPELEASRIAGQMMRKAKWENPQLRLGVCGWEEAALVFYSGNDVRRFGSVEDLVKDVPLAPGGDPASQPFVIVVNEKAREELQRRGFAFAPVARSDTPVDLQAFRIPAFNVANMNLLHPQVATLRVIQNLPPPTTGTAPGTTPGTSPVGTTTNTGTNKGTNKGPEIEKAR
jgi:4-amino-4-deoxy-L-arabinose transferase-like glycosyltransferase